MATIRQKITTYLWFDAQAEEAVDFYALLFDDPARVQRVTEALLAMDKLDLERLEEAHERG